MKTYLKQALSIAVMTLVFISLKSMPVYAESTVICSECDGTGMITCPDCGGKGCETCEYYEGTGKVLCENCDGEGTLPAYTVTFDTQGHGTAPASETVAFGGMVTKPADPTADGYTFGGWYKETACTNAWDFEKDTATEDAEEVTLYAKWTENSEPAEEHHHHEDDDESDSSASSSNTFDNGMDGYVSELPPKTVEIWDTESSSFICDMKVHAVDTQTDINQNILTNYVADQLAQTAEVITTKNLEANTAVVGALNGSKQILTWLNMDINYAGPVYSVVYNPTDKAYLVSGQINSNGTATLDNYILRPNSTVTMFKLK